MAERVGVIYSSQDRIKWKGDSLLEHLTRRERDYLQSPDLAEGVGLGLGSTDEDQDGRVYIVLDLCPHASPPPPPAPFPTPPSAAVVWLESRSYEGDHLRVDGKYCNHFHYESCDNKIRAKKEFIKG